MIALKITLMFNESTMFNTSLNHELNQFFFYNFTNSIIIFNIKSPQIYKIISNSLRLISYFLAYFINSTTNVNSGNNYDNCFQHVFVRRVSSDE